MGELLWSVILPCHPQSPEACVGWEGARISRSGWRPRRVESHVTEESTQDPAPAVSPASPRVRPLCTREHPGSSAAPRTGRAPTQAAAVWRGEGGPPSVVTPVPEKGGGAHIRDSSLARKPSALPKGFFFSFLHLNSLLATVISPQSALRSLVFSAPGVLFLSGGRRAGCAGL